jgi:hypothetical protein
MLLDVTKQKRDESDRERKQATEGRVQGVYVVEKRRVGNREPT